MRSLTLAHLVVSTTPEETVEAAAAAGFGAVGVRICARRPGEAFRGQSLLGNPGVARALRERADGLGIRISNVSAYQFYPDVGWDAVAPAIDATSTLRAPIIVANGFDPDLPRFTALFARYCDAAHAAGIRVALEFLPYSAVSDIDAALDVVTKSGAPNAGILLDALHLDRSGGTPADIARVPPARIVFAQLCDARKWTGPRSDELLVNEARTARLPAGTGELPLMAFMDALPEGIEVEYEVARADIAQATPHEKARQASADAQRFMAAYEAYRRARGPAGGAGQGTAR